MQKLLLVCLATLALLSLGTGLAHDADSVTVQVGAGQDTTVVSSYFPSEIRVEVGETVTFRLSGDEPHTVTFLGNQPRPFPAVAAEDGSGEMYFNPMVAFPTRRPGGPAESHDGSNFVSSGMMSHQPAGPDAPPNDSMVVTFTEPGSYEFYCLLHPWMKGTVIVESEATATTPTHEEIDARAQAEAAPLVALAESIPHQPFGRSEPGPNGTTIWYVNAGAVDIASADPRAASFEFLPTDLAIKAGDTIVWTSPEFHTVSFVPVPPGPADVIVRPQEHGPPQLVLNPEVWQPVKPDGTYQPAQYYNSGILGPYTPNGYSWSLTFDQPGTYEYYCALHRAMGMEGTITVQAR